MNYLGSRVIIVDDADNDIKYSPGWDREEGVEGAYQQTLRSVQINSTTSSFSYEFEGTAISVVGRILPDFVSKHFSWTCAVDGKRIVPTNVTAVLCSARDLTDDGHILTVNVTSGNLFALDAIQYVPSKSSPALENAVMLIDDSDPDIKYDSGWEESAPESCHNATIFGSSLSFDFTGKGIGWVTILSQYASDSGISVGTGTYAVDDEEPVTFPFTVPMITLPQNHMLFEVPELSPGKHTLKVTYNGAEMQDSRSSLLGLTLDYLLVTNAPVPSHQLGDQDHGGNKLQGATMGGIIGGVVLLCLLLGTGVVIWRRKVQRRRYQIDLASEADLALSMYSDIRPGYEVEPFPITSAMREASPLDKLDHLTGKLLARELPASRTNQGESPNNAASPSNTPSRNTSPTPSAELHSGPTNDASQLVRHEDSGIRLHRDVVEVPPEYTEH